jgi:Phytanoyl-CoA dioxygenase (PhyH)
VWTALTDVPRESGPLKFLPGSHKKWAFRETEKLKQFYGLSSNGGFFGYRYEELKVDPTWDPDAADQRVMEMEAGMAVIFTARCVHGSLPNTSTRHMRLGMATRYVPTDVKIYPDQSSFSEHGQLFDLSRWGAVLVAGRDDPKLNKVITANAHGEPFATLSRLENLPTAKLCVGDLPSSLLPRASGEDCVGRGGREKALLLRAPLSRRRPLRGTRRGRPGRGGLGGEVCAGGHQSPLGIGIGHTDPTAPPSTGRICPVTHALAGEARKSTASATSSGSPSLPSGVRATIWLSSSGMWATNASASVRVAPAATALTRTAGAHSWAKRRVM